MNSSMLLPLLLSGMKVSPDLIKNIMEEKKANLEKWRLAVRMLATIIMSYIFFKRASIPAVDSTGAPVYSSEGIQKSLNKSFEEDKYADGIKDSILATIDVVFELLKPTASESILYSSILSGITAQPSTTTVVQQLPQQPQTQQVPWIGQPQSFQNLRTARFVAPGTRAQGVVILADGTVVTE
jgi:hypothetical protein